MNKSIYFKKFPLVTFLLIIMMFNNITFLFADGPENKTELSISEYNATSGKSTVLSITKMMFLLASAFYLVKVINELRKGGERGMEYIVKFFVGLMVYIVLIKYFSR